MKDPDRRVIGCITDILWIKDGADVLKINEKAETTARWVLAIAAVAWFVLLCFVASSNSFAFVFSDEAGYLLPTLFGPTPENYQSWSILFPYPSFLYFWIYSLLPSASLHLAAKILNAAFIAAAAIPAYMVARRYVTAPLAGAFAAVVMLSPISSFVRYVMAEPFYFFGFWLTVLVFLEGLDHSEIRAAVIGGLSVGLLSLIKAHGLAVTLALSLFFLIRGQMQLRASFAAGLQFAVFYVCHLLGGRILSGARDWSLTGPAYSRMLSGHRVDITSTLFNLSGHAGAIVALIGIPLAVAIAFTAQNFFTANKLSQTPMVRRLSDLALLACCLLVVMVIMTVYVSQNAYQTTPDVDRITRLDGRYYLFVFPLFVLLLLGLLCNKLEFPHLLSHRLLFVGLFTIAAAIALTGLAFELGPVDFPDMAIFGGFRGFILFALALLVMTFVYRQLGPFIHSAKLPYIAAILWWAVISLLGTAILVGYGQWRYFKGGPVDWAFHDPDDRVGLRELIGRNDGVVIGTAGDAVDVFRSMFYLRSLSRGMIVSADTEINDEDFPPQIRWMVLLSDVHYIGSADLRHYGSISVVRRGGP